MFFQIAASSFTKKYSSMGVFHVFLNHSLQLYNTPPWVFSRFFKLHKWYQIAQSIS